MPAWAIDEDIWKKAYGLFVRQTGHKPSGNADFAMVSGIYKKLGGRISKKKKESLDESQDRLDEIFSEIKTIFKETHDKMVFEKIYEEFVK